MSPIAEVSVDGDTNYVTFHGRGITSRKILVDDLLDIEYRTRENISSHFIRVVISQIILFFFIFSLAEVSGKNQIFKGFNEFMSSLNSASSGIISILIVFILFGLFIYLGFIFFPKIIGKYFFRRHDINVVLKNANGFTVFFDDKCNALKFREKVLKLCKK